MLGSRGLIPTGNCTMAIIKKASIRGSK
jgi:hypothetical protein